MKFLKIPIFKQKKKKVDYEEIKPVQRTSCYTESLGTLPSFKGTKIIHRLHKTRLTYSHSEALYNQRFRVINPGITATHSLYCDYLFKDEKSFVVLFNFLLDLQDYTPIIQEWIIAKFFDLLRKDLCSKPFDIRGVLIRCREIDQYPFCKTNEDINLYWSMTASHYWMIIANELQQISWK